MSGGDAGSRPPVCQYFDVRADAHGEPYIACYLEGIAVLRLVLLNKGTAFSRAERVELGLEGLLPPEVNSMEVQVERAFQGYQKLGSPIARYQYLRSLQERHEILFYRLLAEHLEQMLPIVYTPTVGEAVQLFNTLYQNPRGLSLTRHQVPHMGRVMANYPMNDVRMIVATDSSAILGIGDQGYGGLAISIGKLALYTAGGGVSPMHTLPVLLDAGTDRADLIADPMYLGVREKRLIGRPYFELVDAFAQAVWERWPRAVIQWEDLSKETAFAVLERHRERGPSFNDDIQGTGAVALAGLLTACRVTGRPLTEQTVVVHGAGAGGIGVAWAIRRGMVDAGASEDEARRRVLVLDSRGLLVEGLGEHAPYKQPYAQPADAIAGWRFEGDRPGLLDVVANASPTALLGLSGQPGAFGEDVAAAMAQACERPIIFPLSNPTSSSEAHPQDLLRWTEGRALVATGSPFDPADYRGVRYPVGQGNNAFIFPGLGMGAQLCGARRITDGMVLAASYALARYTERRHGESGLLYPPVSELREVSVHVATAVIERAVADEVAAMPEGVDTRGLRAFVQERFWQPRYLPIRREAPPS